MNVQIAEMTMADYDEAIALWRSCEGVALGESDSPEAVAAYLARNPGMSFVAREDGRLVGCALCGTDGRRGYMHHLAVAADRRGRGLGKALVARCTAVMAKGRLKRCNIFVLADNEPAAAFYRSLGWQDWSECGIRAMTLELAHAKENQG